MKVREYVDKTGTKRFHIVFENKKEADTFYRDSLHRILQDTRYYLDHLDEVIEFQVSWINYGGKDGCMKNKRRFAVSKPHKTERFINES